MKKLYALLFSIFLVFIGGIQNTDAQSKACTIDQAYLTAVKYLGSNMSLSNNIETLTAPYPNTELHIKSHNCEDGLKVFIKGIEISSSDFETDSGIITLHKKEGSKIVNIDDEREGAGVDKGIQEESDGGKALPVFPKENGDVAIGYYTSSHGCYDNGGSLNEAQVTSAINEDILPFDCYYYPEIYYKNVLIYDGSSFFDIGRTTTEVADQFLNKVGGLYIQKNQNKILLANCDGVCDDDDWDLVAVDAQTNSNCKIDDISFSKFGGGTSITNKSTKLTINNTACYEGFKVSLHYAEPDMIFDDIYSFSDDEITNYPEDEYFIPPANKPLILSFKTSEDVCYEIGEDTISPTENADCKIGVRVRDRKSGNIFENADTTEWLIGSYTLGGTIKNFEDGVIFAECDLEDGEDDTGTDCDTFNSNWKLISSNAINSTTNAQFIGNDVVYDTNNPCYRGAETVDGIDLPERYDPKCYEFLAPIPGIQLDAEGNIDPRFDVTEDVRTGEDRISIRDITTYQLGSFINKLFQIAVAILGVVAVIMIIIAGVEYMTVESIYGKSDAKKRITGAATGLILALGIFVILNTINPQLLNINFGENLETVSIEEDEAAINEIIANDGNYPGYPPNLSSGTYVPANCPEGIVKRKSMYVCKTMADGLENMINKATADGIALTGGGFRTAEQQKYLRIKNGCPDFTSPSKTCRIPTAPVGKSNHESGKAIDFQCTVGGQTGTINVHEGNSNGTKKDWTRPCFEWLKTNAKTYGFINFKKENWHWSVNGK